MCCKSCHLHLSFIRSQEGVGGNLKGGDGPHFATSGSKPGQLAPECKMAFIGINVYICLQTCIQKGFCLQDESCCVSLYGEAFSCTQGLLFICYPPFSFLKTFSSLVREQKHCGLTAQLHHLNNELLRFTCHRQVPPNYLAITYKYQPHLQKSLLIQNYFQIEAGTFIRLYIPSNNLDSSRT